MTTALVVYAHTHWLVLAAYAASHSATGDGFLVLNTHSLGVPRFHLALTVYDGWVSYELMLVEVSACWVPVLDGTPMPPDEVRGLPGALALGVEALVRRPQSKGRALER